MSTTTQLLEWMRLKLKLAVSSKPTLYFKEQEIWWTSVGINIGFEINGKNLLFERPVLIFKKFNQHAFWGLPLTSKHKDGIYYFHLQHVKEKIDCDLISTAVHEQ